MDTFTTELARQFLPNWIIYTIVVVSLILGAATAIITFTLQVAEARRRQPEFLHALRLIRRIIVVFLLLVLGLGIVHQIALYITLRFFSSHIQGIALLELQMFYGFIAGCIWAIIWSYWHIPSVRHRTPNFIMLILLPILGFLAHQAGLILIIWIGPHPNPAVQLEQTAAIACLFGIAVGILWSLFLPAPKDSIGAIT